MSELSRRIAGLSPEKRALLLERLGGRAAGKPRIGRQPRDPAAVPLSLAQHRLWLLEQLDPGTATYNIPYFARFEGALDVAALERSLDAMIARHEVLRTTIRTVDGKPVQVIAGAAGEALTHEDLSGQGDPEAALSRRLVEEARRPFDLAAGPLLRCRLFRLGTERQVLLLVAHHIVVDGWSLRLVFGELGRLYSAFAAGEPEPLEELPIQYADFAIWQQSLPADEREAQQATLAYWKETLQEARGVLGLPTDHPRPPVQSLSGGLFVYRLPSSLAAAARDFARGEGLTLFAVYLAVFAAYLHRITGERDLLVGAPFAGRGREEVEPVIGFFVNTLPLRLDLTGEPTLLALARRAQEVTLDADAHQELPFERLIEELNPPRDLAIPPLFQVMFTVQTDWPPPLALPGLTAAVDLLDTGTSKLDLTLFVHDGPPGTELTFEYCSDLFEAATVERMAGHLETLLAAGLARPQTTLTRLPLLTPPEIATLAAERDGERLRFAPEDGAYERFAARMRQQPQREALRWQGEALSYGELARRAAQLAVHLATLGVGPEVRVGVLCRRTPDLVVALLGVLGARGAYVPVDPAYPAERVAFILADSGCRLLVTQEALLPTLPAGWLEGAGARLLCLDRDAERIAAAPPAETAGREAPAARLSHLIYTSGSTGRPKGVALPVSAVAAFIAWAETTFSARELSGVVASTSVCFDLSVFEIFVTLAAGGTVILVDDALALATSPDREAARLLNTVPSAMAELVRMTGLPAGVVTVNLAGEPLKNSLAQAIYDLGTVERVYDLYGPSEDTTYSTFAPVTRGSDAEPSIGRAIANGWALVVDRRGEPLPAGVPGELLLGGDGLARGYLDRPALTAEKFVPDPLAAAAGSASAPGARLYRTGDLARRRPDGNLDYLGRIDHQVKIRGFRIELGEIEAVLGGHPAVREAVVTALAAPGEAGDGSLRLVAYVVPAGGEAVAASELRVHLLSRLPDYMAPAAFVSLDALPLTPNGKVDRKALPPPDWARPDVEQAYVAPRTAVEETLAALWTEVLGVERPGVKDNFFFLGGHSLLATQLVTRIEKAFGVRLVARDIFRAPTVEGLASLVVEETGRLAEGADLEALLAQLEDLSDEDAKAQLSAEATRRP